MIAHIYVYNILYMYMYIYIPPKLIFVKLFRRPEFFAGYSFPKAACDLLSPRHLPGPAQYPGVRADEGLGRHLSPAAHLPGLGNAATDLPLELQHLVLIPGRAPSSALRG